METRDVSRSLWDCERNGRWINGGCNVIDYKGNAIVVYCGANDDNIIIQFVFHEREPGSAPRAGIEAMLLGKVIVSEEQKPACWKESG